MNDSNARKMMADARRQQIRRDARSIGIDPESWVRLVEASDTDPLAAAVVAAIRVCLEREDPPLADTLAMLLADAVDAHARTREYATELARSIPLPPIIVPRGKPGGGL